jgi:prepilin-type processing-associated H-X9-DG protein
VIGRTAIHSASGSEPGAWDEPRQDTPGLDFEFIFGSPHPGGFNVVFCDGSVRSIRYDIDATTHCRSGVRSEKLELNCVPGQDLLQ